MADLNKFISVACTRRQQFWDWTMANSITVENWGVNVDTRCDIWRIDNEEHRAFAALKWS